MESLISLGLAGVLGLVVGKVLGRGQISTTCMIAVFAAAATPTMGAVLFPHFDFSAETPRLVCALLAVLAFDAMRRVAERPI